MIFRPYPFQDEAALAIERLDGRCLLAMDMGLGKTPISLLWARRSPEVRPIVVLCQASLKHNWAREAFTHFGMHSEILEGRKPFTAGMLMPYPLVIINYDILTEWVPFLQSLNPQLIIIDECQAVSNRHAQRTKATRALCQNVPHVIALSGTPMMNRPAELWPILNILRPDVEMFRYWTKYGRRYCGPRLTPWGMQYRGASHKKELRKLLNNTVMVRYLKKDVLHQLPSKRRMVVTLEIERRKEYNFAERDFLRWLSKHSLIKAGRAEKAEQVSKMGYLKRLAAELKMKAVVEWIDRFLEGSNEKIILFAIHKKTVKHLRTKYGRQCVVVDGSTSQKDRVKAFDAFRRDRSIRVFVGNIRAAGAGWSAKGVSTTAFVEMDWVPAMHTQAEDRTHGIGRGAEGVVSEVFYLIAANTIEEKLCAIIQNKQQIVTEVLDGKGRGEELDVFNQLARALRKDQVRKKTPLLR